MIDLDELMRLHDAATPGPYMKTTQYDVAAWNSLLRTLSWTKEHPAGPIQKPDD